ncbi:hypothetical protein NC651_005555 [Populus alba x Populus x berolinensis]|nr:hypothetical protein NC651_005555 [Populus alba x Populus x berolinensis]
MMIKERCFWGWSIMRRNVPPYQTTDPFQGCGDQQRQQEQEILLVFCRCDQILSRSGKTRSVIIDYYYLTGVLFKFARCHCQGPTKKTSSYLHPNSHGIILYNLA